MSSQNQVNLNYVDASGNLGQNQGLSGAINVAMYAWSPTLLQLVQLTVNSSGQLVVSGSGGGGGGSVTQGTIPWVVANTVKTGVANSPQTASVTSTDSVVLVSNTNRKKLVITNAGTDNVFFGDGLTAVLNSGIMLVPNGVWVMDDFTFTTNSIHAISPTSSILAIQEYQ